MVSIHGVSAMPHVHRRVRGCRVSSGCRGFRSEMVRSVPGGQCRLSAVADPGPGYRVNMPASAELRRMRRVERWIWMGIIVSRVARRVVAGKAPQPGWLPRRWLTVVSGDVDPGGGIGAVWLVRRPGSAEAETHTALMER